MDLQCNFQSSWKWISNHWDKIRKCFNRANRTLATTIEEVETVVVTKLCYDQTDDSPE